MIRLIPKSVELLGALDSADAFRTRYRADVGPHLDDARDRLRQTLDYEDRVTCDPPWRGYFAVDEESGTVVGSCGFKGNPSAEGTVEIAYGTFASYEGCGYATAMAGALVKIARGDPYVRGVIAHTLPERNASCRVLEKTGFRRAGEIHDPDDGAVWQWRIALTT